MKTRRMDDRRWLLVLDRGEELVTTVTEHLVANGIQAGFLSGIGAVRNLTIAWYDLGRQEYLKRTFEENMELGNLTGTIGTVDGKPFLHAHVTVSGPELIAFSGHLVRGEVAVTAELLLTGFEGELPRVLDEEVGLNLIRLEAAPPPPGDEGGEAAEGDEA